MAVQRVGRGLSRVEFLARLTPAEWAACKGSQDEEMTYYRDLLLAAEWIDPASGLVQAALARGVALGLVTPERAAVIGEP